jgi:hypothetical protein
MLRVISMHRITFCTAYKIKLFAASEIVPTQPIFLRVLTKCILFFNNYFKICNPSTTQFIHNTPKACLVTLFTPYNLGAVVQTTRSCSDDILTYFRVNLGPAFFQANFICIYGLIVPCNWLVRSAARHLASLPHNLKLTILLGLVSFPKNETYPGGNVVFEL